MSKNIVKLYKHKKQQNYEKKKNETEQSTQLSKTVPTEYKNSNKKNHSCQQISLKSDHIVNDRLINSLNPKRTSVDLNSFVHVFRKKVRQSSIARQFQNSLQKFKSISTNRAHHEKRQNGGFEGSYKKQNELLVENNRMDNKIKKIIISDMQFKDRKMKTKNNFSRNLMHRMELSKSSKFQQSNSQKINKQSMQKLLLYSLNDTNQDYESKTISFSKRLQDFEQFKQNPQKVNNLRSNPSIYQPNQKMHTQSTKKSSSIFTNRRLQTIATYQRPNLMYNLSLYRKKHSYNVSKSNKKRIVQPNQNETQK